MKSQPTKTKEKIGESIKGLKSGIEQLNDLITEIEAKEVIDCIYFDAKLSELMRIISAGVSKNDNKD